MGGSCQRLGALANANQMPTLAEGSLAERYALGDTEDQEPVGEEIRTSWVPKKKASCKPCKWAEAMRELSLASLKK